MKGHKRGRNEGERSGKDHKFKREEERGIAKLGQA
jgi:hypothetical protein